MKVDAQSKTPPDRAEASKLGVQVKNFFYTPSGPHDAAIVIEVEGAGAY